MLGADLLAQLLVVSPSSLRRYASGARPTPCSVAARLHHLALIVRDLAGAYNDIGVRRWFCRPRTQLGGQTPAELLHGPWDPDDEGPTQVRQLAAALVGSGSATGAVQGRSWRPEEIAAAGPPGSTGIV